jgi:UDP-N-acetylglucosamine--N-acetylmuramyl-(pentapeptide) pyrophosphoryl-undecaprenol N-acetylglucosamine transferase
MGTAILTGVPAMAFEPNAVPGMANRLVGKHVQAAAVNFPPAAKWFRSAEVTGIPVRSEFFALQQPSSDAPPHLLIFGGSQGAHVFNTLLPPLALPLLEQVPGLTILHQAGARHAEITRTAYLESGAEPARWQVEPFLDNMAVRFATANLVLARSGASTVAELAAAGKPSLLVPFALAADDHQRKNADVMVDAGAARLLTERQLADPGLLADTLLAMLSDPLHLAAMAANARSQAKPDAAARIAVKLIELATR